MDPTAVILARLDKAVVDRSRGEHQRPRLHALPHEPVVAGLVVLVRRVLIAENVRFVNDEQVIGAAPSAALVK